jgi:K+-sensing histidine kinase KdpD
MNKIIIVANILFQFTIIINTVDCNSSTSSNNNSNDNKLKQLFYNYKDCCEKWSSSTSAGAANKTQNICSQIIEMKNHKLSDHLTIDQSNLIKTIELFNEIRKDLKLSDCFEQYEGYGFTHECTDKDDKFCMKRVELNYRRLAVIINSVCIVVCLLLALLMWYIMSLRVLKASSEKMLLVVLFGAIVAYSEVGFCCCFFCYSINNLIFIFLLFKKDFSIVF